MKECIVLLDEEEAFYGYKDNAQELIRCKDCMYSKPIDSEWLECQHDKRVMKPSGFCSWADPKEKET